VKETKKRLGKGLSTLLSDSRMREFDQRKSAGVSEHPTGVTDRLTAGVTVSNLPVDKVVRNPHQPRQNWNEPKLLELSESIGRMD